MAISKEQFERLIFEQDSQAVRFTQDSPVYPDVWKEYFEHSSNTNYRADLILTPHKDSSAAELFQELSSHLFLDKTKLKKLAWEMASSGDSVVVKLTLSELVNIALPLTKWWQNYLFNEKGEPTSD